ASKLDDARSSDLNVIDDDVHVHTILHDFWFRYSLERNVWRVRILPIKIHDCGGLPSLPSISTPRINFQKLARRSGSDVSICIQPRRPIGEVLSLTTASQPQ